jgi:hypothetical protein
MLNDGPTLETQTMLNAVWSANVGQSDGAASYAHINPISIVGSVNAGLGAGLETGIPGLALDVDAFIGKTLNLDPWAEKDGGIFERTDGARFTVTVNAGSVEVSGGWTYDARTGEQEWLNPFANGLSSTAKVPSTFKFKPKLVPGFGGKIGFEIDLRSCVHTREGC